MRLFVVEKLLSGTTGRSMTMDELTEHLRKHWARFPTAQAVDEALLATIQVAHVGQVIEWRMGWVFCAEDPPA